MLLYYGAVNTALRMARGYLVALPRNCVGFLEELGPIILIDERGEKNGIQKFVSV